MSNIFFIDFAFFLDFRAKFPDFSDYARNLQLYLLFCNWLIFADGMRF